MSLNLLAFTEVDPNNRYTVTADRVTVSGLTRNETAYLVYDFGVNHFNESFTHTFTARYNNPAPGTDDGGNWWCWTLANVIDDFIVLATGDCLVVGFYGGAVGTGDPDELIYLREADGGSLYSDTTTLTRDATWYYTVERDENVGTYGTIFVYIYSDSTRETLVDTLSIALHTSKKDYRYFYASNSSNAGNPGNYITSAWAEYYIIGGNVLMGGGFGSAQVLME